MKLLHCAAISLGSTRHCIAHTSPLHGCTSGGGGSHEVHCRTATEQRLVGLLQYSTTLPGSNRLLNSFSALQDS